MPIIDYKKEKCQLSELKYHVNYMDLFNFSRHIWLKYEFRYLKREICRIRYLCGWPNTNSSITDYDIILKFKFEPNSLQKYHKRRKLFKPYKDQLFFIH